MKRTYDKDKALTLAEVFKPENDGKWFYHKTIWHRLDWSNGTLMEVRLAGSYPITDVFTNLYNLLQGPFYPEIELLTFEQMFKKENVGKKYQAKHPNDKTEILVLLKEYKGVRGFLGIKLTKYGIGVDRPDYAPLSSWYIEAMYEPIG